MKSTDGNSKSLKIIRSRAPLRISFAGGGTDVPPYPQEKGGAVLSVTINKYAFANLMPQAGRLISVESLDYDVLAHFRTQRDLVFNGELDLVKATIKRLSLKQKGLKLYLHSDAPPGSGLGSSSTLVVALLGAFRKYLNETWTGYDIAELAYQIERVDLEIKGGMQDQYAAAFGGVNFIEFYSDSVIVNPLKISPESLNELEYCLLLCYTGKTSTHSNIVGRQAESFVQKQEEVVRALDFQKQMAIAMKNALLRGKVYEMGDLLHQAWQEKKKLDHAITTPKIDELYDEAKKAGALGGKILGAGGGGYLLLFCPFNKKHLIAKSLEKAGGEIASFGFDLQGLQTWKI